MLRIDDIHAFGVIWMRDCVKYLKCFAKYDIIPLKGVILWLKTIGLGSAATAGALGYMSRAVISNQEQFNWSDLLIETGINTVSGLLSFTGGLAGGFFEFRIPGAKFELESFVSNQILQFATGVYPLKIHLSELKKRIKGVY